MNEFRELVGKTIASVRWMNPSEVDAFGWAGDEGVIIFFTDGSWLVPTSDPEGNGTGFIEIGGNDE